MDHPRWKKLWTGETTGWMRRSAWLLLPEVLSTENSKPGRPWSGGGGWLQWLCVVPKGG